MRSRLTRHSRGTLAIIAGAGAMGSSIMDSTPVSAQARKWTAETIYEQQFDVSAGDRLLVEVGDMDVRVETGGSAGHVRIVARARDHAFAAERFEDMRFTVSASGGILHLKTDERRHRQEDWKEWQERGGAGFEAIVTVPSRFDLDLHTDDGDVQAESFQGVVRIRTGDGDVTLEGASGAEVSLSTGDGDVMAGVLTATHITLKTGDGDVTVREASGTITASTGDGDVSIEVGEFQGLSVRTGDGDVTLFVDPSIRADVEINGEDLALGSAFTLTGRVEHDRLRGTFNGGGAELSVRTGDGSVELRAR